MQRALFLLLIITSLLSCQQEEQSNSDSIHAIPLDAALILETNNLSKSIKELTKSSAWTNLTTKTSIGEHQQIVINIDSSLTTYASNLSTENPLLLSLHLTGAQSFGWLVVSSTENQEQKFQLLEIALKSFTTTKEHPYSSATITEVILETGTTYYTIHKGLLLLSQDKILVEDAIRQLKTSKNLTQDNAFTDIYNSSNKKEDFNLYLNCKNFDNISTGISLDESNLQTQAEWMQWDIDILNKGVLLSGISLSHDSLAQELSLFRGNDGHPLLAPKVLPKNTAIFTSKSFENYKQYQRQLNSSLVLKHQKNKYGKSLVGLTAANKAQFEAWVDSEITWFLAENSDALSPGLILHISDEAVTENYISSKADSLFEYREQAIFKWQQLNYLSKIFGHDENLEYASIIEEQLILTDDIAVLKGLINDYKADKTLEHSRDFQNCIDELNTNSNYFIYLQNPSAIQLADNYLQPYISNFTNKYAEELSPFRAFAMQFNASSSICYSNAYLHFNQSEADETRSIWATQLEAPILSEISLIKNHYDQKWEIAVQDENFNLYLISTGGEILWKKKLNGAIIGSIEQIDLFKNKKLQLLFNTSESIYLVDRKGRDVKKFPIQLKHSTELPLALFDYEKSRNYRILLSCGTHHYMYDKNGNEIKGWKLNKTKSNAIHPAQHFVVAGKDYILLPEENGTLNILNRKGESRIRVKDKIQFSDNKLQVVKGKSLADTRIVTIDRDGVQQNILFDGTIDNSLQFEFDENIQYSYDNEHHILVEGEDLKVNGTQMNLLHSFGSDKLTQAKLYESNTQQYLSITDLKSSQAYLFRAPNDLVEGFPLYGKTTGIARDIDLDDKLNFIVGGESGIIYNYAAE